MQLRRVQMVQVTGGGLGLYATEVYVHMVQVTGGGLGRYATEVYVQMVQVTGGGLGLYATEARADGAGHRWRPWSLCN